MPIFPNKPATSGGASDWSTITNKPVFAPVSTTGAYSDLSGKPTLFDGNWSSLTNKPTTMASAGITDGVTATAMTTALSSYATTASLGSYVSNTALTSALSSYVTASSLATSLTGYSTSSAVTSALATKYNTPTGTTSQYVRGDGSLAAFPGLFDGTYSSLTGKPVLSAVATTGSYTDLSNKPTIVSVIIGTPVSKSAITLGTAYQASDNTKPTLVTLNITSTSSISLSGTSNNEGAIWIGSTSAVASGTGNRLAEYKNSLGGTLVAGLTITTSQTQPYSFILPIGWYYAVRQLVGTGMTVVSAFDQSLT